MISPALTTWPPNRFTPRRWAWESRPFLLDEAPFLCAISALPSQAVVFSLAGALPPRALLVPALAGPAFAVPGFAGPVLARPAFGGPARPAAVSAVFHSGYLLALPPRRP